MVCEKLVTVKILFLGESVVTVFPFILSNTLGELMFAYLSGKQYTKKAEMCSITHLSSFSGTLWWLLCQYSRAAPALINQTWSTFSITAPDFVMKTWVEQMMHNRQIICQPSLWRGKLSSATPEFLTLKSDSRYRTFFFIFGCVYLFYCFESSLFEIRSFL